VRVPVDFPPEAVGLFASDDFVAERDLLVKRLRAEGRSDLAAAVAKLRKPPKLVTAVNRAAQELPRPARAATAAAEKLAAAQATGDRRKFEKALVEVDEAVDRLVAHTAGSAADRATTHRLMRAALTSAEGRSALAQGRLTELTEPAGFDALAGMEITTPRRPAKPVSDAGSRRPSTQKQPDSERRSELEEELSEAKRSLVQAEQEEQLARAARDAANGRVEAIEAALERLGSHR
jgi:hypothetical protein